MTSLQSNVRLYKCTPPRLVPLIAQDQEPAPGHGVSSEHRIDPPSLCLESQDSCASSSPGNLDELHLQPCSQRLSAATQLASRKQHQLESNSISIKIASSSQDLVSWAYPRLSPRLSRTSYRHGTKAERVSSKALCRRLSLVLARTLLGLRAGRDLARALSSPCCTCGVLPQPAGGSSIWR